MNPERLKKRKNFMILSGYGIKAVTHGFILQAYPNQLNTVRVGFTVTKKMGNAVQRNRIRRRLREVIRLGVAQLKVGFDYGVIARTAALTRDFDVLQGDLTYALGILEKNQASSPVETEQVTPESLQRRFGKDRKFKKMRAYLKAQHPVPKVSDPVLPKSDIPND